ncbi:MAG: tetratricopeptide repeat protein [Nitrospinales bacterium]
MNPQANNLQKTLDLALSRHQAGQLEEAENLYRDILQNSPGHLDTLYLLGVLSSQLGKYETAMELIGKVIQAAPDFAEAHYNLGSTFGEQGRLGEAITSYRRAVALNPDYFEAHYSLGKALALEDKPREAASAYRRAIAVNPGQADVCCDLGNLLMDQNNPQEAEAAYQRAVAIQPNHVEALFNLGVALKDQGKYGEAIPYYRRVLEIDDLAKAHYNLGAALQGLGKHDEAADAYRRVLELEPGNTAAKFLLDAVTGERPKTAPLEYVKNLFDGYSAQFDRHLLERLQYQTPALLRRAFAEIINGEARFRNVLDLGCGTGLSGVEFRPIADRLCGIDISPKMAAKAREKNVYDDLRVGDMVEILNTTDETYDLILAADVFGYVGNLEPVFHAIETRASGGAYFTFSTESSAGDHDYVLSDTGRFTHSRDYIESLARQCGFDVEVCRPANIRKDRGQWVTGNLFVLRKTDKTAD